MSLLPREDWDITLVHALDFTGSDIDTKKSERLYISLWFYDIFQNNYSFCRWYFTSKVNPWGTLYFFMKLHISINKFAHTDLSFKCGLYEHK